METSAFTKKTHVPNDEDVSQLLGKAYTLWQLVKEQVLSRYPDAIQEWNYPGEKYGWSFRMKDKKRAIIYMIPLDGCFDVAFVFGQNACQAVYESDVKDDLKEQLRAAKLYGEGRGLRFKVNNKSILKSVKRLIEIKLLN